MPKLSIAAAFGIGAGLIVVLVGTAIGTGGQRPAASGDAGVLAVFAQTAFGPVRLRPDEVRDLKRPQDFAFQFTCDGTGPRIVHVALVTGEEREILHEDMLSCPAEMLSLEYVLHLDDRAPNALSIETTVEAPHDRPRVARHPVRLGAHQ